MGGPKTTSTQTTANQYGWNTPPGTADIEALRNFQFRSDPRLPHTFARARQNVEGTYDNPTGGFTTPQIKDANLRTAYEDIGQQEGQAYREENYGRQGLDYSRLADIAQMTAPRLTQTGGTSTGTSQTNPGALDTIMKGASIGLMAF